MTARIGKDSNGDDALFAGAAVAGGFAALCLFLSAALHAAMITATFKDADKNTAIDQTASANTVAGPPSAGRARTTRQSLAPAPSTSDIAARAYEIFLERGGLTAPTWKTGCAPSAS